MDIQKIREDFPILSRTVYGKPLVYFDNGATTQKPRLVVDALVDEYIPSMQMCIAECIIFHSRLRNCTRHLVNRYVSLSMPAARVKWCSHGEQRKA